jgi:TolA-binding protein
MVLSTGALAQKTAIYDQPGEYYQDGLALFNKQQYGASQKMFQNTIDNIQDPYSIMRINAEYYSALCAVELFNDDAELLLLDFINKHPESMHIKHIYFQLGVFQYRKKGYKRALNSFNHVDVFDLTKEEQVEFYFKRGYAYFKRDSIKLAKKNFFEVIRKESKYQPPAMYYYSHIAYDEGNYETALKGFLSLKNNEMFKAVVPYYVTHIYYMQKNYDELLKIAPKLLDSSTPKRQPEIARLIGEAYYRTEKYSKAIPYLERYYKHVQQGISATNRYQMAYSYYKIGKYEEAIPYFEAIAANKDQLSQYANYHLAICYVKVGRKNYALNSFKAAYENNHDAEITADAVYNFAKLSYELDYNPYNQALKAFEKYVTEYPNSSHREEAMTYLTKMYLSTNNYSQALESIEKIQNKSPELSLAYQRILYSIGIQNFLKEDYKQAIAYLDKSIAVNKNKSFNVKALYWKAEAYYRLKIYNASILAYNEFLTTPGSFSESNYNTAHYNIGYSYFKLKKYKDSNREFRLFILNNTDSNSVVANDAYNRIGDSYFIQSDFKAAIENYDAAISIGKRDVDYSLYKKAEACGPLGKYDLKAATFEKLVTDYPNSTYAGNAEYALAQTYYKVIKNNDAAIKHFLHLIDTYHSQTTYVKKAKLDLGYLYNNIGETDKAIALLKSVYEDYRGTTESNYALETLQGIYTEQGNVDEYFRWAEGRGVKVAISVQDSANYYVAENSYMSNNCDEAIKNFGHYIERFPTGFFINKAHYYKADCELKKENYIQALKDYQFVVDNNVIDFLENSLKQISYINFDLFKDYPAARVSFAKLAKVAESKENHSMATIGVMRCDWFSENYDSILVSSNKVLSLENLQADVAKEAKKYIARVYIKNKDWENAEPVLNELKQYQASQESAEAQYYIAYIAYDRQQYDTAETLAYNVIQQEPSYEEWVVKSFILSSDIFVKKGNLVQAKATLESIVNNYTGDESILQEAKDKLQAVMELLNKENIKEKSPEMIIDLGKDSDLFIDSDGDISNFNEEFEEEEPEN